MKKSNTLENERNQLAIERTKYAEERTNLAYIRTGFSIMIAGIFFTGFFGEGIYHYIGYGIIFIGILFSLYGILSHRKSTEILRRIEEKFKKVK
ncbi:MAG: DUF202 domain-containing protein [Candidatus ainarchaeum sp.]|nr:DUF202 domain-containing protein [Candidatus ainarchaeum sp.]